MSTAPARGGAGGRVALGVVLVIVGVVWLASSIGALDVDWAVVLPAALVVVGLGVLVTARSGGSGPLIGLGVVLTIISVISALASPAFSPRVLSGGIGDRDERPATLPDPAEFQLGIGELTVDLREVDDLSAEVDASVGIGHLVVIVPDDVDVELDASVAAGEVRALGEQREGLGPALTETFPADARARGTLVLDVSVALGQVEVRR